jgi:hypothetical protein
VNILDENIIDNQRRQLKSWRLSVLQIGYEVGRKGMKDREIIPFLHQQSQPTFFTRDDDFYDRKLCHEGYCLVYLDVRKEEAATFIRRLLRHNSFNTKAKRMGKVIRTSHVDLSVWKLHSEKEVHISWDM